MSLIHERTRAVRETLDRVKRIGLPLIGDPTEEQIEAAQAAFRDLSTRTELFPAEQFPYLFEGRSGFYRIGEDPDHLNALYIQVSSHRIANSPHKHPYWAIITGVRGDELNVLYERVDDGSEEGKGRLGEPLPVHIRPGVAFYIHNKYFHTINIEGEPDGIHLHFYAIATDTPQHQEVERFKTPDSDTIFVRKARKEAGSIGVQRVSRQDVRSAAELGEPVLFIEVGEASAASQAIPGEPLKLKPHEISDALGSLPSDRNTPVVLVGEGHDARVAAEKLTRLGYFSTFWFDPSHGE